MFNSILYSIEIWGDISCIEKELRLAEQKALRSILKVKEGTSIDLLYNELKRPDIISKIKDAQRNFYQRLQNLNNDDAMVKSILNLCNDTSIVNYYKSLAPKIKENNIRNREQLILESDASMLQYYTTIVDVKCKCAIYTNYINDRRRSIITRWRLSNHKLLIEIGRYNLPYIPREERKCIQCNVLEDEAHAIYFCPAFGLVHQKYIRLLNKYTNVKSFLNPGVQDIYEVSDILSEIEEILKKR